MCGILRSTCIPGAFAFAFGCRTPGYCAQEQRLVSRVTRWIINPHSNDWKLVFSNSAYGSFRKSSVLETSPGSDLESSLD